MKMTRTNHDTDGGLPHWDRGLQAWLGSLAPGAPVLVAVDFDGTLSEIVDRPEDAVPVPGALDALAQIATQPRVCLAVVSGRSLADLRTRLFTESTDVVLVGNHGLEVAGGGIKWDLPSITGLRKSLEEIASFVKTRAAGIEGLLLEDKTLSLSLHYRLVPQARQQEVFDLVKELPLPEGIRLHPGKSVMEFRPNTSVNKGSALRRICDEFGIAPAAALFVGDDVTDEDGFVALPEGFTVKVGPSPQATAARFYAPDPASVVECLNTSIRLLQ